METDAKLKPLLIVCMIFFSPLCISQKNQKQLICPSDKRDLHLKHETTLTGSLSANHISSYQPADRGDCCQGSNVEERCCGLVTKQRYTTQISGYLETVQQSTTFITNIWEMTHSVRIRAFPECVMGIIDCHLGQKNHVCVCVLYLGVDNACWSVLCCW